MLRLVAPFNSLGHHCGMKRIRHCQRNLQASFSGMHSLLWLLAASVAIAGAPRLQIHAHEAAGFGHEHVDAASATYPDGPETTDRQLPPGFHVHDATVLSFGIDTELLGAMPRLTPFRWISSPPVNSPPLTPRTPPHRPPIV